MEFLGFLIVVLALLLIFGGLLLFTKTRSRRAVPPPRRPGGGGNFEIINWRGQPQPPPAQIPRTRRTRKFSEATRWQNPEALCLLTGRRAADCSCETHRSLT